MKYQKRIIQTSVRMNNCSNVSLTLGEMWQPTYNNRAEEERGEHITRRTKKNGEKSIYFPSSQNLWYNIINKGNNTTRECKKKLQK